MVGIQDDDREAPALNEAGLNQVMNLPSPDPRFKVLKISQKNHTLRGEFSVNFGFY